MLFVSDLFCDPRILAVNINIHSCLRVNFTWLPKQLQQLYGFFNKFPIHSRNSEQLLQNPNRPNSIAKTPKALNSDMVFVTWTVYFNTWHDFRKDSDI